MRCVQSSPLYASEYQRRALPTHLMCGDVRRATKKRSPRGEKQKKACLSTHTAQTSRGLECMKLGFTARAAKATHRQERQTACNVCGHSAPLSHRSITQTMIRDTTPQEKVHETWLARESHGQRNACRSATKFKNADIASPGHTFRLRDPQPSKNTALLPKFYPPLRPARWAVFLA